MNQRSSGVLLHLTSLPGPYGIGKFGPEAIAFAQMLAQGGFAWWQVLPFNSPAAGDSPYQSFSAFAGNPKLIDPRRLYDMGLLSEDQLMACRYEGQPFCCDFAWLEETTERFLRQAYANQGETLQEEVNLYRQEQQHWLPDYACYMALRRHFGDLPWWEWPDVSLKRHDQAALQTIMADQDLLAEMDFHGFVQYIFDLQWQETKKAIHAIGIRLIGDIPVYVARDSCDVWANRNHFELDQELMPIRVAGVPPDYFSEDGQLWGNPLYNWSVHAQEYYRWWIDRVRQAFRQFDRLRLDHFRGYAAYWAVPAAASTARAGLWCPGPGHDLFNRLFEHFPRENFIAEDLGEIDEAVRIFLAETGLPGMRVMQFGFEPWTVSTHLPCYYPEQVVAFTGTHDNNTMLGWLWEAEPAQRRFALDYAGFPSDDDSWQQGGPASGSVRALIRTLWATAAHLVIVPVQDLLGYGSDTRMNTPGIPTGQWRYRTTAQDLERIDTSWLSQLNRTFKRTQVKTTKQREALSASNRSAPDKSVDSAAILDKNT